MGNNQILGNFIGTDVTGSFAVANNTGASAFASLNSAPTLVGGTVLGSGNLISGNTNNGLVLSVGLSQGNLIGTAFTSTHRLGNGRGVFLNSNATLGGTTAAARNIVSGNLGDGVFVAKGGNRVQGNYIGTDITGTVPMGNSLPCYRKVIASERGRNIRIWHIVLICCSSQLLPLLAYKQSTFAQFEPFRI